MKKSLLILTAALTFGGFAQAQLAPSAAQVPALTDVPAGHWAKDAIDRLVSRGIILGYPDGTFRGTHNLTRYEASIIIARLLDQINSGVVVAPQGDDLSALQNAVQELSADLAALGVRVSDIEANAVSKDDFARLEARVDALGAANGNPEALADLEARISGLGGGDYDALRSDVDDLASSITALNDLTVLLNQDILDLQDRVSNLEATQDFVKGSDLLALDQRVVALDGRVTHDMHTLSTRVAKIESGPKFSVFGGLNAGYGRLVLTKFTNKETDSFDVSRLTNKTFAYGMLGDKKIKDADTTDKYDGDVEFGIRASNIMTADKKVVVNNAELSFGIDDAFVAGKPTYLSLAGAKLDGTLDGQKFSVAYASDFSGFKFNDYLFNNPDSEKSTFRRGVVAEIEGSKLFLAPKLTVVAGNALPDITKSDNKPGKNKAKATIDVPPSFKGNYFGIRASVNPFTIGTVGLAYAQNDDNRTALGVDFDLAFGPKYAEPVKGKDGKPQLDKDGKPEVEMKSPYTLSGLANFSIRQDSPDYNFQNALNSSDKAYKVDARANFGVAKLGAQYLRVDPAYAYVNREIYPAYPHQNAGMSTKKEDADTNEYKIAAAANVGPVAVNGYYTSAASISAPDDGTTNAFGVAAGLQFRALKVAGFYNSAKLDGKKDASGKVVSEVIDYSDDTHAGTDVLEIAKVPHVGTSTYGGFLSHDGNADDAFVKGLNFTVADAHFYNKNVNDLQVYGNYTAKFAGITLQPFARYHMLSAPASTEAKAIKSYNTIKYGVEATTEPFVTIPLQPSVYAKYAGRTTTNQDGATNGTNIASETLVQAGVTLNRVITDGLKASVGYAYYKGSNVGGITKGADDGAYKGTADHIYSTPSAGKPFEGGNIGKATGSINGIYAQADWNGWTANYGIFNYFNNNDKEATSIAQGFNVGYKFKF